ncbi:hypothetical protein [Bradyrhizobium australafricanum]|uniref:hypothetical protein n=1 Tax=Bradyrhizobium australafricanum TaxID=2821406 RepID=UPI001CE39EB1|nr:hypothetical protein [Bradyrhizobium australafricanum]MCA6098872.1 hypothetical protein [Bradyrhizobium australafricanum]
MTVRLANVGDTERVVALCEEAFPASPFAPYTKFSPEMARNQFLNRLGSRSSLCLVYEVAGEAQGIFVGAAVDYPNAPLRIGIEIVKWISPAHRGPAWPKMVNWFEAWAIGNGCTLTNISDDGSLTKWCDRNGYQFAESNRVKPLY